MSDYKKDWTKHPAPERLFFHYHPQPEKHAPGPSDCWSSGCGGCVECTMPAPEGDIWHHAYSSKAEAEDGLRRMNAGIAAIDEGWIVEEYVHVREVESRGEAIRELQGLLESRGKLILDLQACHGALGIHLLGWNCSLPDGGCGIFNSEMKERLKQCRNCGKPRPT